MFMVEKLDDLDIPQFDISFLKQMGLDHKDSVRVFRASQIFIPSRQDTSRDHEMAKRMEVCLSMHQ
jgi:hypothetical protein